MPRRAVFLDRDGVINAMVRTVDGIDSPQRPEEFRLLPGVAGAIADLNSAGFAVVVVSNQPGIAKGKSTPELVAATTGLLLRRLTAGGGHVDGIYYCHHHPQALFSEYRCACQCRKPQPGLLLKAAAELDLDLAGSFMVGDQITDLQAGQAAGCRTVLVTPPRRRTTTPRYSEALAMADAVYPTLAEAVRMILSLQQHEQVA